MTPFPCGRCLPCKINNARIWQHRLLLEQRTSTCSCFVTLTYDDDFIPHNYKNQQVLCKKDLQNYLKRLRRRFPSGSVRYFGVGEYGDLSFRPHYHLALFGVNELDKEIIDSKWPFGFVQVGDLTQQSARYIVGYVIKKLTSEKDERLEGRLPEFMLSSRQNGGIGYEAVRRIGLQLKKNKYWEQKDILQAFKFKGSYFPIGGYLTKVLAKVLGTPESEFKQKFYSYQEEFFSKHYTNSKDYYWNIVEEEEQTIKSIENRHQIYKQRRSL